MLVQSRGGEILIRAALPKAWPEGSLHWVRARSGVELDLEWANGRMKRLRPHGKPNDKIQVRYRDRLIKVVLNHSGKAQVR